MLIIKKIPNVFSPDGREQKQVAFERELSVFDVLQDSGFEFKDRRIIVSGKKVDDLSTVLNDGDEIIILSKIEDPITAFFISIGLSATLAAWATVATVVIAIAATAYAVYSAITGGARKPSNGSIIQGNVGGLDESSPTYGWDGITLTQQVGTAIPIVYGKHRAGGNIINQYVRSDGDKQYLNVLIALSEGEIADISDIKINDNSSDNYDNITLQKRFGTNNQLLVDNFNDSHSLESMSVNLTKDNPYVHTTVLTDITAFEVQLKLPAGLYQASGSGTSSWEVDYRIEYKLHSDVSYIDLGVQAVSAMSRTALYRNFKKTGLTAGQYDIRVTRTSDDSTLDPVKAGDLALTGVDEMNTSEPLIYPNVALLAVEALATDQLNGAMPNITSLVKGRTVLIPDIRNGGVAVNWEDYYWDAAHAKWKLLSDDTELTWNGTTYVSAWSANPVWCMKDLLTNAIYGLGEYIDTTMIDAAQMLEMAKYCEEKVDDGNSGFEKRFQLNVVIDSTTKAIDLITQLCSTFRCFPFYSNGTIKLKIDKAEAPVQLFGMGNIIENSFMESWKSIKEIPNVAEIQFLDASKDYKQEMITVIDEAALSAGDTLRKKTLRLFCTSASQCIREGKYFLNVGKNINKTVQFRVGIDGIACQAGDVINVSHDLPQWGTSGRAVAASTTTRINLDKEVVIEAAKTYKVNVRFSNDTQELRTVTNAPGTYNYLTVSVAFSQAPGAFDVYAFGENNSVQKPFRLVSISRAGNNEVELIAMEYVDAIYDAQDVILPEENYSGLSSQAPNVTDLALTEDIIVRGDGTVEDIIDVWFARPLAAGTNIVNYSKARVYISDNDGESWIFKGDTIGEHFRISGGLATGTTYKIAVVSVNNIQEANTVDSSPQESITTNGKSANPSNVTNFTGIYLNNYLTFAWSHVTDRDLAGYEIRQLATAGSTWASGTVVASGVRQNAYTMFLLPVIGTQYFAIKAIDTTGNYSTNQSVIPIYITNGVGLGDIFVVDKNPANNQLYLTRIPNGEYGMVLTCGGLNQAPFWDWVYSAAGGLGALAINRFITLKSYNGNGSIIMNETVDKVSPNLVGSSADASVTDSKKDLDAMISTNDTGIITFAATRNLTSPVETVKGLSVNYYVGTVSITHLLKVVTGVGTNWLTSGIAPGDKIGFGSTQTPAIVAWYTVGSVDSATQITIVEAFAETTLSGAAYVSKKVY